MLRAPRRALAAALLALLPGSLALPAPPLAAQDADAEAERDKEFFRREMVLLDDFPRTATRGTEVTLRFRVQYGYRSPVLVVVYPDGRSRYTHATAITGGHEVAFRLDPRGGNHRVSIVVDSDKGDWPAAQFIVKALDADGKEIDRDVDFPPADTEYPLIDPEEHLLRAERILYHRMNALRRRKGLPPLPWFEAVAALAREHFPALVSHYEKTFDPRRGWGELPHKVPGAGEAGGMGPSLAERAASSLGWPSVVGKLPPEERKRGEGEPNFLSEAILNRSTSLHWVFEQNMLRRSDMRAPMVNDWTTHAAGAAHWRVYDRPAFERARQALARPLSAPEGAADPAVLLEKATRPARGNREIFAILVFIQVNDPKIQLSWERDRREAFARVSRASRPEEKAEAYRLLGQGGYFDGVKVLRRGLKDRRPEVAAGALDGLWLVDPEEAGAVVDRHRVRIERALDSGAYAPAAGGIRLLSLTRYDAASGREARAALERIRKEGRERLDAVDLLLGARRLAEAKEAFESVARDWAGFPEGEEARLALKQLLESPQWKESGDAAR